jgi:hypothetical protein
MLQNAVEKVDLNSLKNLISYVQHLMSGVHNLRLMFGAHSLWLVPEAHSLMLEAHSLMPEAHSLWLMLTGWEPETDARSSQSVTDAHRLRLMPEAHSLWLMLTVCVWCPELTACDWCPELTVCDYFPELTVCECCAGITISVETKHLNLSECEALVSYLTWRSS